MPALAPVSSVATAAPAAIGVAEGCMPETAAPRLPRPPSRVWLELDSATSVWLLDAIEESEARDEPKTDAAAAVAGDDGAGSFSAVGLEATFE